MTANWYEAVKRREGDVDAYIAMRQHAYLDRWKEAGRFIPDGAKVLDIGCGNLYPALFEYFVSKNLDYHCVDVDQSAVDGSREIGARYGYKGDRFAHGFNDEFSFSDGVFDAIFSSHCIEHSFDLSRTFAELSRLLKFGGMLLMAVPLGWEENPEHPYFFTPEQWLALVQDSGFEIRVAQIGREYPESGYDYFIAAKKVGAVAPDYRIRPDAFRKDAYNFVSHTSGLISYTGSRTATSDGRAAHLKGDNWSIKIAVPPGTREILAVFVKHDWSALLEISSTDVTSQHDLFSWFPYAQPQRHTLGARAAISSTLVLLRPVGRNEASRATEGVFCGAMYR